MEHTIDSVDRSWSLTHRIGFRFFAIFVVLGSDFWAWIPWVNDFFAKPELNFLWSVRSEFFSIVHLPYSLTQDVYGDGTLTLFRYLVSALMALVGAGIWSVVDRKRVSYPQAREYLRSFARFFVAYVLLVYGFAKVFLVQMPVPSMADLYRPLGDFSPGSMPFVFVAASQPYEFFTGILEVVGALLLFWRRTTSVGAVILTIVMSNVVLMDICYAVPVRYLSAFLLLLCLYLLSEEGIYALRTIVLRRTAPALPEPPRFPFWRKMVWGVLVLAAIYETGIHRWVSRQYVWTHRTEHHPALFGSYDVIRFEIDSMQLNGATDINRWNQVVVGSLIDSAIYDGFVRRGFSDYLEMRVYTVDDSTVIFKMGPMYTTYNLRWNAIDSQYVNLSGDYEGHTYQIGLRKDLKPIPLASFGFGLP